jgi:hypothetical protein
LPFASVVVVPLCDPLSVTVAPGSGLPPTVNCPLIVKV